MLRFIIRRLVITIPTILVVITITWGLVRLAPGNFYTTEKVIPPAIEKNIREKYGLDKPWYEQYWRMMWGIVRHFDFGTSLKYEGQSVNAIIARSLPVSATVGLLAYLLAVVVGVIIGSSSALKPNSARDYISMAVAMLGISIPNFVLGPILVLIFSLTLYWLPPSRWNGFSRNLLLPVLTLSALHMAYVARLTRAGMLEVLRSDYIRTARAKGLSESQVVIRHALRGGLMPVVSYTGPALAFLVTGTVVVEKIFVLPGLGNYFIQASFNRDEPLIIGIVAFIAITLLLMNLLVDIAYAYLDPRIRY